MKKILLSLCAFLSLQANAQIIWQEDFASTTAPGLPAGWLQINGDNLAVSASIASWNFGTNAWVTRDLTTTMPTYGKIAASTSWYSAPGTSNDWMITPAFTPTAGSFFEWESATPDASYPDGFLIKVSTNGGTTQADFPTTLLTVAAENSSWTKRAVDLSAYVGQSIRIAIVNNSFDKYLLYVDNVKANKPTAKDGSVTSASVTRYTTTGPQTISGNFRNLGGIPVTSAVLNYQVGTSTPVSQTFNFSTPVSYLNSSAYSFTTQANLPVGQQTVKVWVSNINGTGADAVPSNDTVRTTSYVASQTTTRNVLIEEFTSSTCPPCASLNVTFDPLLATNTPNTNGRVNVIKYQMNYPSPGTDPSFNAHSDVRHDFYGVSGIPTTVINGRSTMSAHSQAEIDAAKTEPAYANINANLVVNGASVTATAEVTPYVTISSNSPIRAFQVLLQKFYNYPGASTTQKDYNYVMRKMSPDGVGAAVNSLTSGTALSFSFNNTFATVATPAQLSYDLWNSNNSIVQYVIFLQDTVSGHILQSAGVQAAPTGIVNLDDNKQIGIYPNPANTNATLAIKTTSQSLVDVKVIDLAGRVVYSTNQTKLNAGTNEISFSTVNFVNGVYNVVVTAGDQKLASKLVVAH